MIDLQHGQARLYIGDVFARMADLPDGSIDLIVTSPPFLALRSYLPADHPDKHLEIGSEATPAEFLDTLLALTAEWRRLLAPHGSIAVELGDTYAGSGGAGGDYNADGLREGQEKFDGSARRSGGRVTLADGRTIQGNGIGNGQERKGSGWPLDKSLSGIPTLYTWSLAYGRNLLTGQPSPAGQWRIRNLIPWVRPNPPVGALGDKCRPATSYITVATIARDRWFDMEDCRTAASPNTNARTAKGVEMVERSGKSADRDGNWGSLPEMHETAGAPLLDWWNIPTQPYKGAHYATFPTEIPARLIKLMCPRDVCRECGQPRRRIVETANGAPGEDDDHDRGTRRLNANRVNRWKADTGETSSRVTTLGWSDCGHNNWRPGLVCDPFAGSGTTLEVATGLGRAAIGIDLDARNADLARERVGMFLHVIDKEPAA